MTFALVLEGEERMENALLMLTGIALVVGVVTFLDWLGRRKDRRSPDHAA